MEKQNDSIPESYAEATWRNTLPVDPVTESIGISFSVMGGIVRLRIDVESAKKLMGSISQYLKEWNDGWRL